MSSKAPATSCHSVWPDVGIKSSPNFTNNAQKGATTVFTYRVMLFTVAQKISKYLGHFCKTICNQQLQKSPNLVTLVPSQRCSVGFSWGARRREEDGGDFFPLLTLQFIATAIEPRFLFSYLITIVLPFMGLEEDGSWLDRVSRLCRRNCLFPEYRVALDTRMKVRKMLQIVVFQFFQKWFICSTMKPD